MDEQPLTEDDRLPALSDDHDHHDLTYFDPTYLHSLEECQVVSGIDDATPQHRPVTDVNVLFFIFFRKIFFSVFIRPVEEWSIVM